MNIEAIVDFVFELGQLKRERHNGFMLSGVKDPDSVGEHAFRTAQIAFLLAVLEGIDPYKTACIALIHDNAEARIQDRHKVSARYLSSKEAEFQAFSEQIGLLPQSVQQDFAAFFDAYEQRDTREGVVAKDADWLETAFQAHEYAELGYKTTEIIDSVEKALETESAKNILASMKQKSFTDWWQGLKKMTYKKLS